MWWTILFGALSLLLQWLLAKKAKGERLEGKDLAQGNRVIAKWHDVYTNLVAMGCSPGGADAKASQAEELIVANELKRLAKRLP